MLNFKVLLTSAKGKEGVKPKNVAWQQLKIPICVTNVRNSELVVI